MNTATVPDTTNSRGRGWKWLQFGVTLALLSLLLWLVDWKAVGPALRNVHVGWASAVVGLVLLERMVLNLKWQALLSTGGVHMRYLPLFRIQLAANALGTFLPSSIGVDALRMAGLWQFRERRHEIVAATLLDRLSTVLATLVVSGVMIVLVAGTLVGEVAVRQVYLGGAVAIGAALFLLAPPGRRMVKRCIGLLPSALRDRLLQVGSASLLIAGHRRAILITLATSLGAVALRVLIGKGLLLACGVDVPLATLGFVLPVVWGTAMLPISIGGLGIQDATYVLLLRYAGVGSGVAIVVSLLDHVLTRIPIVFGVLFWRDVVPTARARDATTP
jgi:glycosyltransferase 2 family protein